METTLGHNNIYVIRRWHIIFCHFSLRVKTRELKNINPLTTKVPITLPDDSIIKAKHNWKSNLPHIPAYARLAYIVTKFKHHWLIFSLQLCVDGCQVLFTNRKWTIYHNNKIFLEDVNNSPTNLLMLPNTTRMTHNIKHPPKKSTYKTPSAVPFKK